MTCGINPCTCMWTKGEEMRTLIFSSPTSTTRSLRPSTVNSPEFSHLQVTISATWVPTTSVKPAMATPPAPAATVRICTTSETRTTPPPWAPTHHHHLHAASSSHTNNSNTVRICTHHKSFAQPPKPPRTRTYTNQSWPPQFHPQLTNLHGSSTSIGEEERHLRICTAECESVEPLRCTMLEQLQAFAKA